MRFPKKLEEKIKKRKNNNVFREVSASFGAVDFSSNDYLGFSKSKQISDQVFTDLDALTYLNGSTGSRLITGTHKLHTEVESQLALFFKTEAALLFNSGYDANLGLLASVPQRGDVILYDELCHASIRDGIKLSNAKSYSFKHNDLQSLEKKYNVIDTGQAEVYVVVESIYSMDGDQAPLQSVVQFCKKNKINLIVDEAHATGVFGVNGEGLVVQLGLQKDVFACVYTFGKAMGCHGAVVVGSQELIHYLVNYARSFIYTTAMPLHSVLTIKYAVKALLTSTNLKKLQANIILFKATLKINDLDTMFIKSDSAIQSCVISDINKTKVIEAQFKAKNFEVKAILSPTVSKGEERLRFCIHSYNSSSEIKEVIKLLRTFT